MKDDLALWAKYFSGNCSEEEECKIKQWIGDSYSNREHAKEMHELWAGLQSSEFRGHNWDVDAGWENVQQRINLSDRHFAQSKPPIKRGRSTRQNKIIFRAGALLVVTVLTLLSIVVLQQGETQAPQLITYESGVGERMGIRLNDGSMVYLGVQSMLIVPELFSPEARDVALIGEAYFEIAEEAERPFTVNAGQASVQVLGTEFNLRSYTKEENVALIVTEGSVAFYPQATAMDQASIVVAGQQSVLNEEKQIHVWDYADLAPLLSWREGRIIFENTALTKVLEELARWYDVQFSIQEELLGQIPLTTSFDVKSEPIENIIDVVASITGTEYQRVENTVLFFRK